MLTSARYANVVLTAGTAIFRETVEHMTNELDGFGYIHDEYQGGRSTRERERSLLSVFRYGSCVGGHISEQQFLF